MKELQKQNSERSSSGTPLRSKLKLAKGARFVSFLFIAVSILVSAGIMQAANVYYDLDSSKIIMSDALDLNVDTNKATNINTGTNTSAVTLGGGSNDVVISSDQWAVTNTGNISTEGTLGIADSTATNYTYFQGGAGATQTVDITYTLPTSLPTGAGWVLQSDASGVMSWSATGPTSTNALLDGTKHTDTTAGTVVRGDIITGQGASATWTRLGMSNSGGFLTNNGTDVSWGSVLGADHGGTGVANLAAETLTITGGAGIDFTVSGATTVTLPTSGTLYGTLADSITSANLASSVTNETGSGLLVFATSPTLTTPNIGAASGTSLTLSAANALTLGTSGSIPGQIVLKSNDASYTQTITGSDPGTASIEYIFPAGVPAEGQVLIASAPVAGVSTMSWANSSGMAGGAVFIGQAQVFGFDYPARTASTSYIAVSKEMVGLPIFPTAVGTREYRFGIRYADTLDPADATPANRVSNWEVYQTNNTPAQLATFDVTAAPGTTDADLLLGTTFVTGVVDLSGIAATDSWVLRVKLPAVSKKIQIYSIDLLAFDN